MRLPYILVKGTITVANTAAQGEAANNANRKIIFKSYAPFANCINRINNTQVDDAHVIPIYNLMECSDDYSKTKVVLWHYCRDEPVIAANGHINYFHVANAVINSFNHKEKIRCQPNGNGTKKCWHNGTNKIFK